MRENPKRAVIVDDAPQIRPLIKIVLAQFGIKDVVEAEDGAAAMEALMTGETDIIIMDWMMPGMDGLECTRRIRAGQNGIDPNIPIIVVTGVQGDSAEATARMAGANGFIRKPFSIRMLNKAFLSALGDPKAE